MTTEAGHPPPFCWSPTRGEGSGSPTACSVQRGRGLGVVFASHGTNRPTITGEVVDLG